MNDVRFISKLAKGSIDYLELLSKKGLRTNTLALRPTAHIPFVHTYCRHNSFIIRGCETYKRYSTDLDSDMLATSTATNTRILWTTNKTQTVLIFINIKEIVSIYMYKL